MKMSCLLESPDHCLPLLAQFFDTFPSFLFSGHHHILSTSFKQIWPLTSLPSKYPNAQKIFSVDLNWHLEAPYHIFIIHFISHFLFHSSSQVSLIPSVGFTGPHHHETSLNIKTQDSSQQIWKAKEVDYMNSLKRHNRMSGQKIKHQQ